MTRKKRQAKPKSEATTPSKVERPGEPLAPAPGSILLGVVVFSLAGVWLAAQFDNDWIAVAVCTVVLTLSAITLDRTGRARAAREPNPLYKPNRLPADDDSKLKVFAVLATLVILLVVIGLLAEPGKRMSPFPFFFTAGFLVLVLPQLLARRVLSQAKKPD